MRLVATPQDAEQLAARIMEGMGYHQVRVTLPGPDGGIDVWSTKAVAQVKFHQKPTGRPDIQKLYGARGLNHDQEMLFFSYAGFTKAAVECANDLGTALFVYDSAGRHHAANSCAEALIVRTRRAVPHTTWHSQQSPTRAVGHAPTVTTGIGRNAYVRHSPARPADPTPAVTTGIGRNAYVHHSPARPADHTPTATAAAGQDPISPFVPGVGISAFLLLLLGGLAIGGWSSTTIVLTTLSTLGCACSIWLWNVSQPDDLREAVRRGSVALQTRVKDLGWLPARTPHSSEAASGTPVDQPTEQG
ncbi:restriction endonuclease [Nocardia sp. NPDC058705]|uniref:restriction endonuclease n=1 Tax=Nocardia sp. NPDC058705 TaxID=3346609 RepID=UPI003684E3BA